MPQLTLGTLDGGQKSVSAATIDAFTSSLRGRFLTPTAPDYDAVRAIWNAMIDRRPGLIVRAAGAADILATVRFAREHQLLLAVRGAGHNIAGLGTCEGGLLLDLSTMRSVHVDPLARRVRVEPGATLGDLDAETQAFALAVPTGINSTTGIAGLTLGGGFGWLSRKHGMTIDNLLSADVVTADGQMRTASAEHNPDLFWGIRGGGGNFGVVTSFEFRAHPVGPQVLSGLIVHPWSDAAGALRHYRTFADHAPDELTTWVVLRKAPPLPFLPADVHGKEVVIFAFLYAGDIEAGRRALEPLRSYGSPVGAMVEPHAFCGWQKAFDPLLTPGLRNYWKSHNFRALDDAFLETLRRYVERLPSPHSEIFIGQMGGAQARVAADATAYPHRDAAYVMNVHTRWETAAADESCVAWARGLFDESARFATGGVYINFMPADETDRVGSAYGATWDRLVALKAKYDPTNLFRVNQNIRPQAKSTA